MKSTPIPVKFDKTDLALLDELVTATGLSRSELLRRAVRLFLQETSVRSVWDVLKEVSERSAQVAETPRPAA